ncbi:MAG: translation initiation factor IF-3 [Patescibacteria group bacterium]|nr:translation initiation factor IF-3 [Patescibacteria group bacterium]
MIDEKAKMLGKMSIDQARMLAYDKELDLMEVSANTNPPVCKLMDVKKIEYQKNKQIQKQKSKQKNPEVKEVKLSINIGQHDMEVKAKR